jgi:serine/threonine protein kinase
MDYTSGSLREQIQRCEQEMRNPGSVLFSQARYEIVRTLGQGGMGITCLAEEISTDNLKRPVVLKFVKDSLSPQRLSQFLNEVQLSILFNHPNLVPMYRLESEVITVEPDRSVAANRRRRGHTVYYAVMQFIDGWNLRQIVSRMRELGLILHPDISLFMIGRVARGLHYVHEYRDENGGHLALVHRDVSPENILVDRFARIKVSDFGIAMATKRTALEGFLHAGNLLYCAPEQLSGIQLDRRCDIYNIGLLMYFMFTNTDRFAPELRQSDSRERIRRKMSRSPLDDMQHIDERLARMCDTCLAEDPESRYQNCEDLANDIDIYFQKSQKVVTNEQLEEILHDVFSPKPTFVSRRFIPLTGSAVLEQPGFDPASISSEPEPANPMDTALLNEQHD